MKIFLIIFGTLTIVLFLWIYEMKIRAYFYQFAGWIGFGLIGIGKAIVTWAIKKCKEDTEELKK